MNAKILSVAKTSAIAIATACTITAAGCSDAQDSGSATAGSVLPSEITIDYANWNPLSLIVHDKGLVEEEFKDDNVKVNWIVTQSGNKSMEFLMSGSVDLAVSPGTSPLLSHVNGNPVTIVSYVSVQNFNLVTAPDSGINQISDLKGKRVSATPGTCSYFYAVKSLSEAGIGLDEVTIVPLQAAEGYMEMARGRVEAYSGGEPLQSIAEAEGLKIIPDNTNFSFPLVLCARTEFLEKYPQAVNKIINAYEMARQWGREHPDEFADLAARNIKMIPREAAEIMIKRLDLTKGEIDDAFRKALSEQGVLLKQIGLIKEDVSLDKVIGELTDNSVLRDIQG